MPRKNISFQVYAEDGHELSELEIVQATIEFLNGAKIDFGGLVDDPSEQIAKVNAAMIFWSEQIEKLGLKAGDGAEHANNDLQAKFRSVYRLLFSAFVSDPKLVGAKLSHSGITLELPAKTYLWPTANGMTIVHRYWIFNFHDLTTVGQALLFDEAKPFARKLCQCQMEGCGKFFFEKKPPTGRPTRKYCSKKHMLKAHDDRAASRMTRSRSNPVRKK